MKRTMFATILALGIALGLSISMALADTVPVQFTFTADNVISAWYKGQGDAYLLPLPVAPADLKNWRVAKTATVNLDPSKAWEVIFMTINDDNDAGYRAPSGSNPGGFMAQITPTSSFSTTSWITSKDWQVAVQYNSPNPGYPVNPPVDYSSWPVNWANLSWAPATEYGKNGVSPWGGVSGISNDANWIWTAANFGDQGAPGVYDYVFEKIQFQPVPEPTTMLLLGLGLTGVAGLRRKFQR